jgi:hypothetical protein
MEDTDFNTAKNFLSFMLEIHVTQVTAACDDWTEQIGLLRCGRLWEPRSRPAQAVGSRALPAFFEFLSRFVQFVGDELLIGQHGLVFGGEDLVGKIVERIVCLCGVLFGA